MPKKFLWGPGVKKNRRADLRHHVNFVFPATPQVRFLAYILIAHFYCCFVHVLLLPFGLVYLPLPPARYLVRKSLEL